MTKSSRRRFFTAGAGALIGLPLLMRGLGLGAQKTASDPSSLSSASYEWKMATTWPPGFPVLGEGANYLAELIEQASGGRIRIKVYGAGELVPALGCFDAVRTGAIEMGSGASYYWAGKMPASQLFATVPFGMNAQQMTSWIMCGGGYELWRELYGQVGLVPFLGGNTGVQMGGWFNKEINAISDLKGLKMRMPGLGGKVLQKAGGTAVLLSGGEIYTGLERGIIDATEWIGPYHDYTMGFHEIANYYYTPGWHEPGTAMEFFVNKDVYDSLPTNLQGIIEACCQQVHLWILSEFEAKNSYYLDLLLEAGVELRQFPSAVLEKLRLHAGEVMDELVSSDASSRKIYASYLDFHNRIGGWSSQTEGLYHSLLQKTQDRVG